MSEASKDWVLTVEAGGRSRSFPAEALPVTVGGEASADFRLEGVRGAVQIGLLDGVFFVQPARETRNLRVDGSPLVGSRRLRDGDVVALDAARLQCALSDGRLALTVEISDAGPDTTPPDLEELARAAGEADEVEIVPVAFRPRASDAGAPSGHRPSIGVVATAAGFLVLAVLAWFAFTAKSVALNFDPEPSEVGLPGTLFKLRLGDRYLLRSGEHRVVAEVPGYYPLETVIEVGREADQSIDLKLTKLPGLITLAAAPEVGATVALDGQPLGQTPLRDVEIPPGEHKLEFSADRYLSEVRELTVTGGGRKQSLTVALTPNWAPVTLNTEPSGAEVLVDGTPAGATPLELELEAGERHLEARLHGYNAWQDTITVGADQPQHLPLVKLTRADGRVDLASEPADAAVSVDGRYRGRTPLTLRLSPGAAHMITLTKPGYDPASRELSVEADSGRKLRIELRAQLGVVEVRSEPASAELWIDGRRQGTTPARVTLTAIAHRIEVRQQGYAKQTAEVTPKPGFPQVLDVELEALDATTGSGYPRIVRTSLGQELRIVAPGKFTMGSSRREQGHRSNEILRPVELSRAFYLGTREVTNAEYRAFKPDHDSGSFSGVSLNGDDQPVVRVGWDDVAAYANWLSIKDGLQPVYEEQQGTWAPVRPMRNGYRLPTEAEWAWAARFAERADPLVFPWGAELPPPDRSGNYADLSARDILKTTLVTYNDGFNVSAPPGSFAPNAVDIYDLGGNVAEWVQDFYRIVTAPTAEAVIDPLGPETGRFHVVRDSSWRSATVTELRLAYRAYSAQGREDLGFRLARNLE